MKLSAGAQYWSARAIADALAVIEELPEKVAREDVVVGRRPWPLGEDGRRSRRRRQTMTAPRRLEIRQA
jgi:hypothetical protein